MALLVLERPARGSAVLAVELPAVSAMWGAKRGRLAARGAFAGLQASVRVLA